jgi:hypothetical protein
MVNTAMFQGNPLQGDGTGYQFVVLGERAADHLAVGAHHLQLPRGEQ